MHLFCNTVDDASSAITVLYLPTDGAGRPKVVFFTACLRAWAGCVLLHQRSSVTVANPLVKSICSGHFLAISSGAVGFQPIISTKIKVIAHWTVKISTLGLKEISGGGKVIFSTYDLTNSTASHLELSSLSIHESKVCGAIRCRKLSLCTSKIYARNATCIHLTFDGI